MNSLTKKNYLIKGGKVLTPFGAKDCDVLVQDGKIAAIEKIITKIEKIENGKIYLLPADGKKGRVFDL